MLEKFHDNAKLKSGCEINSGVEDIEKITRPIIKNNKYNNIKSLLALIISALTLLVSIATFVLSLCK